MGWLIGALLWGTVCGDLWAIPLAAKLDQKTLEGISEILNVADPSKVNLEYSERRYQRLVQPQTLSDLAMIYDPNLQDQVKVTLASFTPEDGRHTGEDLGFGLHVVKRLVISSAKAPTKVIYVNELWPHNRKDHGILLPDEIRVQTRYLDGALNSREAYRQYLFDSIRVAWGVGADELQIMRQTLHRWDASSQKNVALQRRVEVAPPFSCVDCHYVSPQPESYDLSTYFAEGFLEPKEKRNFVAIVQDSHFTRPVEQMKGYREYMSHLARVADPKRIQQIQIALRNLKKATTVPSLRKALLKAARTRSLDWLGEDVTPVTGWPYLYSDRQGYYFRNGQWFLEGIEDVFEGKYRWWEPVSVIP